MLQIVRVSAAGEWGPGEHADGSEQSVGLIWERGPFPADMATTWRDAGSRHACQTTHKQHTTHARFDKSASKTQLAS